jgi:hypothetical protein
MDERNEKKFKEWETLIRRLISFAEEKRLLGCAECAKSLLLYGMKLHKDAVAANLDHIDFSSYVDELTSRTVRVRETCKCDKREP